MQAVHEKCLENASSLRDDGISCIVSELVVDAFETVEIATNKNIGMLGIAPDICQRILKGEVVLEGGFVVLIDEFKGFLGGLVEFVQGFLDVLHARFHWLFWMDWSFWGSWT